MVNYKNIIFSEFVSLKRIWKKMIFDNLKYSSINYVKFNYVKKTFKIPKIKIIQKLNMFEQIKITEPEHSKIIGNLLNPNGTHGSNDLFLNNFFKIFIQEIIYNRDDYWNVTVEKERYDIRIRSKDNSKIIIIENKSNNAEDKPNQLYRYWYNGIYIAQLNRQLNNLECFSKVIYLSPSDYKQPEKQSLTCPDYLIKNKALPIEIPSESIKTYFFDNQIITWLDLCLEHIDCKSNLYYYLSQYRDFWR